MPKTQTLKVPSLKISRIQSVPNSNNNSPSDKNNPTSEIWSTQKNQKSPPQSPATKYQKTFTTPNRYAIFSTQTIETDNMEHEPSDSPENNKPPESSENNSAAQKSPPSPLPPPIFIKSVINFDQLCIKIREKINPEDQFICKSSINGIKLTTNTPNAYRAIIKFLQESKAEFHTYQIKQDRAFRVVIRNLHHSTDINNIKNELEVLGFRTRNINNVIQKQTKQKLPLFFVDLEPAPNNRDIFNINSICYTKIKIEEPRVHKDLVQCQKCQGLGHTKKYCNHTPKCVKCGNNHLSENCTKSQDQPPICALCGGEHTANYRGCPKYKELQRSNTQYINKKTHQSTTNHNNSTTPVNNTYMHNVTKQNLSSIKSNQLWTENFYFVIVADVQFGYVKPPVKRDSKDWKIEMDKAIFAIDKINNLSPRPQFLVVCGDLVNEMPYNDTVLNELQVNDFKKVFSNVHPSIPLVCLCGNHDIGNTPDENSINKYRDNFGQDYFSFWCGGVLFLVLNSQYYKNSCNVDTFAAKQDQWLTEILSKHKGQRIIVFQHIPWFLSKPDEDVSEFNIEKNIRHEMLEKLFAAGVSHVFSGHYHRNSTGFYKNLEIVTTSALGAPLGEDPSGLRVVKMYENNVIHTYYPLEQIPSSIQN